jgi:hypothetical protein
MNTLSQDRNTSARFRNYLTDGQRKDRDGDGDGDRDRDIPTSHRRKGVRREYTGRIQGGAGSRSRHYGKGIYPPMNTKRKHHHAPCSLPPCTTTRRCSLPPCFPLPSLPLRPSASLPLSRSTAFFSSPSLQLSSSPRRPAPPLPTPGAANGSGAPEAGDPEKGFQLAGGAAAGAADAPPMVRDSTPGGGGAHGDRGEGMGKGVPKEVMGIE